MAHFGLQYADSDEAQNRIEWHLVEHGRFPTYDEVIALRTPKGDHP